MVNKHMVVKLRQQVVLLLIPDSVAGRSLMASRTVILMVMIEI